MHRMRSTALGLGIALATVTPLVASAPVGANSVSPTHGAEHRSARRAAPGEISVTSRYSFDETWANLIGALEANPNIQIIAQIDHAAAAAANGLELEPNRVVVFGNPNLGTPLMQSNQTAGLDLPQKMHVTESGGEVTVSYNSTDYLVGRHRLRNVATTDTIAGALAGLAEVAAGEAPDTDVRTPRWYRPFDGLQTRLSDSDIDTTWDRLLATIEASPANVAFTVDHGANAAANGLELRPTRLVVFGNPNLGTPLMQTSPSAGIDLPLKILVWEDARGQVLVTTTNPFYLVRRHRIFGSADAISATRTIDGALDNFVRAATTAQPPTS